MAVACSKERTRIYLLLRVNRSLQTPKIFTLPPLKPYRQKEAPPKPPHRLGIKKILAATGFEPAPLSRAQS